MSGVLIALRAIENGAHRFQEIEARSRIPGEDLRHALCVADELGLIERGEDHDPGWYLTPAGDLLAAISAARNREAKSRLWAGGTPMTETGQTERNTMTEDNITTTTITLPVRGDGTALENTGVSMFGLVKVESRGILDDGTVTVMYVPDPDNDQKTIFWVRGIQGVDGHLPEGDVTLTLTYREM